METSFELSVIIVSYNAKYYLINTLHALEKISKYCFLEIIVVDNDSTEYSILEIKRLFPLVRFIKNERNYGFSKANNIGVQNSSSENLLFLNPDTIISLDVINDALSYIDKQEVGGVSVKMIDGKGSYLPESNRQFPTLYSSFLKLTGLHYFIRNNYYSDSEYSEVFAGACLFMKRDFFSKIGRWDERYFMYGEDIDLSLQIKNSKRKILYRESNPIVHFKGKSTDKSVLKNNVSFYNAMKLYWDKNLCNSYSFVHRMAVNMGTLILTFFSWFKFVLKKILNPLFDFTLIYLVSIVMSFFWSNYVKKQSDFFTNEWYLCVMPIYILVVLAGYFFNNRYNYIPDLRKFFHVSLFNLITCFGLYFFLPSDYKFSRFMVLFLWALSSAIVWSSVNLFSKKAIKNRLFAESIKLKRVPSSDSFDSILWLNQNSEYNFELDNDSETLALHVDNMNPKEWINNIESQNNIWLVSEKLQYAIKSTGKDDWSYIVAENYYPRLSSYRWKKQIFEKIFSLFILLMIPILFFISNKTMFLISASMQVLFGNKTWLSTSVNDKNGVYNLSFMSKDIRHEFLKTFSISSQFIFLWTKMFIKDKE